MVSIAGPLRRRLPRLVDRGDRAALLRQLDQTASGFLHVSNAPTAGGACEGATTLAGPDVGIRECGDLVVYVTAIPSDLGGNLFGTIERFEADGSIIGLTSVVAVAPSAAPAVDLDALCGS